MKTKRNALAYRREIVGHTQETLAEFVGVQPTTVGRWERGETSPQPWSRPKLAEALAEGHRPRRRAGRRRRRKAG